jgi:hypothetical protein
MGTLAKVEEGIHSVLHKDDHCSRSVSASNPKRMKTKWFSCFMDSISETHTARSILISLLVLK